MAARHRPGTVAAGLRAAPVAVLLAALLLLGVAGCGGSDKPTAPDSTPATSATGSPATTAGSPPTAGTTPGAPEADPSPTASGTAGGAAPSADASTLPRLTIRQTGGIAGVDTTTTVSPRGVVRTLGSSTTRTLSEDELSQLSVLVNSPALRTEAGQSARPNPARRCNDVLTYSLEAGSVSMTHTACDGKSDVDTFTRIIGLVLGRR